jgi:hypothetical protein
MVFQILADKIYERVYDMTLRDFGLKPLPFVFTEYAKKDEQGNVISERKEIQGTRTAPEWAVRNARNIILRSINVLKSCCTKANLIYPVTLIDCGERRKYQTRAISQCSLIPQKVEFYSRKLGFKLEPWKWVFKDLIELEKVLKGWRSSDRIFESRILRAYTNKEVRIRNSELRKFLYSHGTFLDTEDLKIIFETEDPWEMLRKSEDMINEIIFGVTPKVKKLLEEDRTKIPYKKVTEPSKYEKKIGEHTYKDMAERNKGPFREKGNAAPADPLQNKQQKGGYKPPFNPNYKKKQKQEPLPSIAQMVADGTYSETMNTAYKEHIAENNAEKV